MTTLENIPALSTDRRTKRVSKSTSSHHASTGIPENSCAVTMVYRGPPPIKSNGPYTFKVHADEVLILQSHTDLGTKSVFKGSLKPNDVFTFKSCRLVDRHFSITIYINGIIDQHVFVCCERGFVSQSHFPTKWTSCQLHSITAGVPCEICQSHELMNFRPNEVEYEDSVIPAISYESGLTHTPSNAFKPAMYPSNFDLSTKSKSTASLVENVAGKSSGSIAGLNKHIPNKDSNALKTSAGKHEEVNAQDQQSGSNIDESKNAKASLKQTNANDESKILNEDKTKISQTAREQMDDLLTQYLLLFQTNKSIETEKKDQVESSINQSGSNHALAHANSTGDANRQMNAAIQCEGSPSMPAGEIKAESFVLIWLDPHIGKNKDAVSSEQSLRAIVNSLNTCHEIDEARDIIDKVHGQQVYLIVSGERGQKIVEMSEIVDSPKVNSIYIFCQDQSKHETLRQSHSKVRDVFVQIDPLCKRLKEDTEQALKNLLPFTTSAGASADDRDQTKFLCAQLQRDLLFTMEYNNNARLLLADFCTKIYGSSPSAVKHIAEFRDQYHAGKALRWYTAHTFLYKMLNKAFYNREIATLYKFNFFIKDLHTRLEQMHALYKLTLKSQMLTVYRGLTVSSEYFERCIRAEVNNLIAFDSFLSTSLSEDVAIAFARDKQDPKAESVVFRIEIDTERMERPFADISGWSVFKDEQEVLFSIGTVFRIDKVIEKKTDNGIWIVHLRSVSEEEAQLKHETQQIQVTLRRFFENVLHVQRAANNDQLIPVSFANVASMFYKQGVYEESLTMYTKALDSLNKLESPDPLTQAMYTSNIAKTHMMLGHTNEALTFYGKALEIRRTSCEPNDPSLVHTFHTIAELYRDQEKWDEALEQYKQVLQLEKTARESKLELDPATVAATLICMGNIFHQRKRYAEARECFSKALAQQHAHLSKDHPVLAFLYNNIGSMYYKLDEYKPALENQLQCLKIETETLPERDKTFIDTYKNIANSYEGLRKLNEAEQFARKYLDQTRIHYSEESPEVKEAVEFHRNIEISRDNRQ